MTETVTELEASVASITLSFSLHFRVLFLKRGPIRYSTVWIIRKIIKA